MSTWRVIPDEDVELDGQDVNVLISTDSDGNNYIILSTEYLTKLLTERGLIDE